MKFDAPTEFFASTIEPEVRHESNHCGLTKFQQVGMPLEIATSEALRILEVKHKHNHFDYRYAFETEGTDIQTRKDEIECKNLSGKYRLRYSWIKEEITNRFRKKRKKNRILVISHDVFSRVKRLFLRKHEIRIVEVGFQVTYSNLGRAIQVLVSELRPVLHVGKKVSVVCCCFSKLVGYSYRIPVEQRFLPQFLGFG